jgi:hypothetical protein
MTGQQLTPDDERLQELQRKYIIRTARRNFAEWFEYAGSELGFFAAGQKSTEWQLLRGSQIWAMSIDWERGRINDSNAPHLAIVFTVIEPIPREIRVSTLCKTLEFEDQYSQLLAALESIYPRALVAYPPDWEYKSVSERQRHAKPHSSQNPEASIAGDAPGRPVYPANAWLEEQMRNGRLSDSELRRGWERLRPDLAALEDPDASYRAARAAARKRIERDS